MTSQRKTDEHQYQFTPTTVTMQPTPISIRKAGIEDNELIAALGRRTFFDSFAADNHPEDMDAYLDKAFSPNIQAAELAQPSSFFLIAEAKGVPVGYARLAETPVPPCIDSSRPIQLMRLYACNERIGSGVGSALMSACIAQTRGREYDGIWLGVWSKNRRAIRFYRKWGFSEMGTQPFLLGNDRQTDLVLWLPLKVPPQ